MINYLRVTRTLRVINHPDDSVHARVQSALYKERSLYTALRSDLKKKSQHLLYR